MATKILAIDDSKTMRLAVKITFAAEGVDVTSVSKGSEALARAKQLVPDVVLVDADLGSGEPSGYDVCEQLKGDAATAGVPVILMVSNRKGVDQARFAAVGANAFVTKPFDTQDLIDKVTAATGHELSKPGAGPVAGVKPVSGPRPAPVPPAAEPATAKPAAVPSRVNPKPVAARPASRPSPAAARPSTSTSSAPGGAGAGGAIPIAIPIPFTAADNPTPSMLRRLSEISDDSGIDPKVAEALVSLSREVIESVVWEVVPDLAEEIIKRRAQSA